MGNTNKALVQLFRKRSLKTTQPTFINCTYHKMPQTHMRKRILTANCVFILFSTNYCPHMMQHFKALAYTSELHQVQFGRLRKMRLGCKGVRRRVDLGGDEGDETFLSHINSLLCATQAPRAQINIFLKIIFISNNKCCALTFRFTHNYRQRCGQMIVQATIL